MQQAEKLERERRRFERLLVAITAMIGLTQVIIAIHSGAPEVTVNPQVNVPPIIVVVPTPAPPLPEAPQSILTPPTR